SAGSLRALRLRIGENNGLRAAHESRIVVTAVARLLLMLSLWCVGRAGFQEPVEHNSAVRDEPGDEQHGAQERHELRDKARVAHGKLYRVGNGSPAFLRRNEIVRSAWARCPRFWRRLLAVESRDPYLDRGNPCAPSVPLGQPFQADTAVSAWKANLRDFSRSL